MVSWSGRLLKRLYYFSSFEYDGYLAVRGGHHLAALAYVVSSVVLGYAGVWLGASLVTKR